MKPAMCGRRVRTILGSIRNISLQSKFESRARTRKNISFLSTKIGADGRRKNVLCGPPCKVRSTVILFRSVLFERFRRPSLSSSVCASAKALTRQPRVLKRTSRGCGLSMTRLRQRMRISVGYVKGRPGIRRGAHIENTIPEPIATCVPASLVCRPVSHARCACRGAVQKYS